MSIFRPSPQPNARARFSASAAVIRRRGGALAGETRLALVFGASFLGAAFKDFTNQELIRSIGGQQAFHAPRPLDFRRRDFLAWGKKRC